MGTKEFLQRLSAAVETLKKVDLTELSAAQHEEVIDLSLLLICQVEALRSQSINELRALGPAAEESLPAFLELELTIMGMSAPRAPSGEEMSTAA